MNIFEQYGIKEVADVCLYAIELDENDDEVYVPVLYLDTLKVSTVEETAEQTSARGGLGNPELIIWDYGKEITVTLEDALYSPASQGMTWGGKFGTKHFTLIGDLVNIRTGETEKAILTVNSFSDFAGENYNRAPSNYTNYRVFSWTIDGYIVGNKTQKRYYVENKQLTYEIDKQIWAGSYMKESGHPPNEYIMIDNDRKFYLAEFNIGIAPPQEVIYQIDHALNNVYFLDRIEKCKATQTFVIDTNINTLHGNYRYLEKYSQCELTVFIDPRTMQPYEPNTTTYTKKNGEKLTGRFRVIKQHEIYYKWTRSKAMENTSLGHQIVVDAIHFPGTYRLVGETYSRSRKTGKDQRFQFEIPLCKMGTENSFTLEAEGDPTTFNMTLKVLRREDGVMMKLTQYNVENAKYDGYISDSTNVIPNAEVLPEDPNPGLD